MVAEEKKESQIETPEELAEETKQLAEVKEEDVRTEIISEFGFDAEKDKERIDKMVAREVSHRKNLSKTIGQKVGYRTKLAEATKTPPKPTEQGDVNEVVSAALEKERLEDMPYSDEIKEKIKSVATINKISVKKAVSDPYIASLIDKWQKDKDAEEAALGRKDGSGKGDGDDSLIPPDFDLNTEQGRKDYDAWKAEKIKQGH